MGVRAQVLEGQQVRLSQEVAEDHPLPAAQAVRAQAQVIAAERQEVMADLQVLLAIRETHRLAAVPAAAPQGLAADPATPSMETAPALVL
jgi:hypothetical protein